MGEYRPWGLLDWLLPKCPNVNSWSLLGCISTEERSLTSWRLLTSHGCLNKAKLLRISNKPSRHDLEIQRLEIIRLGEFFGAGGNQADIESHSLLEPPAQIISAVNSFLQNSGDNVVLDVSALPKRFFFPILKLLLKKRNQVRNLIVTYTSPAGYTAEKLAENFDQWDHLPLFSGSYTTSRAEIMIINIGFDAFGLQDQVEHGDAGLPLKLLFPFPAPPQSVRRSWELVRRLQKHRSSDAFQIYRTDAKDMGDAFDRIVMLSNKGQKSTILAPFGPKPISVAMCIFATLTESQVFYSQPSVYHPNYSFGVDKIGNSPAAWSYCLRLDSRDYYQI